MSYSRRLNEGVVIRLKSGGPLMTVRSYRTRSGLSERATDIGEFQYYCVWFALDERGQPVLQGNWFNHLTLELAPDSETQPAN